MNPIPVLGIPHFNRPELLARCIASIDYPVDKLVIVQQGAGEDAVWIDDDMVISGANGTILARCRSDLIGEIIFIHHPNAGVAGAWNEIIKLFPAEWWLISNNDIEFAPGDLEKMVKHMGDAPGLRAKLCYGNHGASWFGITTDCVLKAGTFDENFYPAYLEDCDYAYRCDVLNIDRETVPDCQSRHGDDQRSGSCTVNATPELAAKNARTHAGNFEYYREKWGGINGEEKYETPFEVPQWPVWVWWFRPRRRQRQQW